MIDSRKALCVFCGARDAVPAHFLEAGVAFGKLLAERGIPLVYGGGDCGMMGAVASAVMRHGGHVTGVFPKGLQLLEREHRGLSEILIVDSMHERKKAMFDRADAFVALPGGFGTLDETFEIITWRQLRIHEKPVVLYNHRGYWNPWVTLADSIVDNGFATPETRGYFSIVDRMEDILPAAGFR